MNSAAAAGIQLLSLDLQRIGVLGARATRLIQSTPIRSNKYVKMCRDNGPVPIPQRLAKLSRGGRPRRPRPRPPPAQLRYEMKRKYCSSHALHRRDNTVLYLV